MSLSRQGRRDRVGACFADGKTYETDMSTHGALARLLKRSAFAYHVGNTAVVARGGRHVKRGTWNDVEFRACGIDIMCDAELAGGHVTIEGTASLMGLDAGPMVIVANHMSSLETFLLPALCTYRRPVSIVVKQSLLEYPWMGNILKALQSIGVTRTNPRKDLKLMLEGGQERLAAGRSMVIFPQSTRLVGLNRSQFNSIGAKLARRAGVKILPVAVQTNFHGVGRKFRDFGPVDPSQPVRMRFGSPVEVTGNGREAHEACVDFIADCFGEWNLPVED